jgi:hypothetical protein
VLSNLHCLFVCSSTGHWQRVSSPIGGNSHLFLRFPRVVGARVELQYCRLLSSCLNCWCISSDIKPATVTSGVPQGSYLDQLCFVWFVNESAQNFEYVRVFFYADDMKLFLSLLSFQDCLKIHCENSQVEWCGANFLELNVGKFKSFTFLRLRHHVEFSYMKGGIILDRVDSLTDLKVVMDSRMSFSKHIDITNIVRILTLRPKSETSHKIYSV